MIKKNRYTTSIDIRLYARNDQEAKVMSVRVAEFIRSECCVDDSVITSVDAIPFASLSSRNVHKGPLSIFENKLVNC